MELIDRIKEWIAPTQETKFKINEKMVVGCKATDKYRIEDGKIKIPGVCWDKNKSEIVENILDPHEIRKRFKLSEIPKMEVKRDYTYLKWGTKAAVFALGIFNPKIYASIKPFTEIL